MTKTTGSVPTSRVHWLTFDETKVPQPRVGVEAQCEERGHDQFGALRREWGEPLHEHELAHTEFGTACDQRLGERLGAENDRGCREREHRADGEPAASRREAAQELRGTDEVRLTGWCARDAHHVHEEEPHEDHGVEQREPLFEGQCE